MKQQIRRLSPHQNAKVFGVLWALGSLVIVVPLMLVAMFAAPGMHRPPTFLLLLLPLLYLVIAYVVVVVACWLYNLMVPHVGGFEFETTDHAE